MKNLPVLCCLIAILFIASCTHKIACSAGVPALSNKSISHTLRTFKTKAPETDEDMVKLLHHEPLGVYKDSKGKTSLWSWVEIDPDGKLYTNIAGCYSVKGKLQASRIQTSSLWLGNKEYGNSAMWNEKYNPGILLAAMPLNRMMEKCKAAYLKRPVYFSPSGETSYILPEGEKFLGWRGEEPRVERLNPAPRQVEQIENNSPSYGEIFLQSLATVAANYNAPQSNVSQTTSSSNTSNSNSNQAIIDYWNRKAEQAQKDYQRYSDMHWGNRGGFSTH